MSGGVTLLLVLGVGLAVIMLLYLLYYISTVASSLNDVQARVRREMQAKEEQFREMLDNSLKQRGDWAKTEADDLLKSLRQDMASEQDAFRVEMTQALEKIVKELAVIKATMSARSGAAIPAVGTDAPTAETKRPPAGHA